MSVCAIIPCLCCPVCRQRHCDGLIPRPRNLTDCKKDYETEQEDRSQQRACRANDEWKKEKACYYKHNTKYYNYLHGTGMILKSWESLSWSSNSPLLSSSQEHVTRPYAKRNEPSSQLHSVLYRIAPRAGSSLHSKPKHPHSRLPRNVLSTPEYNASPCSSKEKIMEKKVFFRQNWIGYLVLRAVSKR
jgi:hypothetical protein